MNGSIETLLQTQAGVTTAIMNSVPNIPVRGGNYDENCVYVNHIEIYRPLLVRSGEQEGLQRFVNRIWCPVISSGDLAPNTATKCHQCLIYSINSQRNI